MKIHKSGETCLKTGKYIEVDCCGVVSYIDNQSNTIHLEIDKQFPPTREENLAWKEIV